MAVKVRIPTPLQKLTNNQAEVQCKAASINDMLADLEKQHPGVKERLCDAEGKLRRFVNIYVNEEDIRFLQGQCIPMMALEGSVGCVLPLDTLHLADVGPPVKPQNGFGEVADGVGILLAGPLLIQST